MGLRRLCYVLVLSGCQHVFGIGPEPLPPDGDVDAAIDAPVPPTDATTCFGHDDAPFMRVCVEQVPAKDLVLSSAIATNIDLACDEILRPANAPEICVVLARSITVTGNVRVNGARPLMLVATTIVVAADGTLEAVGRAGGAVAAGAPYVGCGGTPGQSRAALAGAGGAGGSFAFAGGVGGAGGDAAVLGGQPGPVEQPRFLRGGCNGTQGGMLGQATPGGGAAPGRAGGALYLLAGERMQIDGTINASGAGGDGGTNNRGGGGGASGGMIILEAPTLELGAAAQVFALGGGGGGGGGDAAGTSGGTAQVAGTLPAGGAGGGNVVTGGMGGRVTRMSAGQVGAKGNLGGGGGGGGSVGVIRMYPVLQTMVTSVDPPPS